MRRALFAFAAISLSCALVVAGSASVRAASRTWPPFVLVLGLLLIGEVANRGGLFESAASLAGRVRGHAGLLFALLLTLVALTTAVLNLDTSVAFLTPVLILTARRRGIAEEPFLYGSFFMANSASLLLPGSNLTNLLVLARERVAGSVFALRMAPAWLAAIVVTGIVLATHYRKELDEPSRERDLRKPPRTAVVALLATTAAASIVLVLSQPALWVLAVGLSAVLIEMARGRLSVATVASAVDLPVLAGLFAIATTLGAVATTWSGPAALLDSASGWQTALIGAAGAVTLNNLPAAALFSSRSAAHPRALLIGLNLGPNLAVTGSLSALLWFRAAFATGARPSIRRVSRIGLLLVPCSMVAALLALQWLGPASY